MRRTYDRSLEIARTKIIYQYGVKVKNIYLLLTSKRKERKMSILQTRHYAGNEQGRNEIVVNFVTDKIYRVKSFQFNRIEYEL